MRFRATVFEVNLNVGPTRGFGSRFPCSLMQDTSPPGGVTGGLGDCLCL